jgi:hypothetical protein
MSKYQEFQELFVTDGQAVHYSAGACFEVVEDLTFRMLDYSGWYSDDVEYITLTQPISAGKPAKIVRFTRTGRNRDRIRDVATLVNGFWSLGIRLRLRPHVSVSFYPSEVMFVVPLLIQQTGENQFRLKQEPEGTEYDLETLDQLITTVFEQIQTLLEQGVQQSLSEGDRREEFQTLGFVLTQTS